jgi:hypothetical protein
MHEVVQRMKNEVAYCNLILNSETGTLSGIPPPDGLRLLCGRLPNASKRKYQTGEWRLGLRALLPTKRGR